MAQNHNLAPNNGPQPTLLRVPKVIKADHCLLRYSGLPEIDQESAAQSAVVCYRYSTARRNLSTKLKRSKKLAESSGELEGYISHPLSTFYNEDANPEAFSHLEEDHFPYLTGSEEIRVVQLPKCSSVLAKAVISTLSAHGIMSRHVAEPGAVSPVDELELSVTALEALPYNRLRFPNNTTPVPVSARPPADQNHAAAPPPDPADVAEEYDISTEAASIVKSTIISSKQHNDFLTGVSLAACFDSPYVHLSLFVAMPYLSRSSAGGIPLCEYLKRNSSRSGKPSTNEPSTNDEPSTLFVHQAWLYVQDNETIAIFRSPNTKETPLFHYQERLGAYQAIVQMISNIIASDLDCFLLGCLTGESDLNSAIYLARSQIRVLRDLGNIYRSSLDKRNECGIHLPIISDQPEQLSRAYKNLQSIIESRRSFISDLEDSLKNASAETVAMQGCEMLAETESMRRSIEMQGQTISLFTLITALFLPLNFLAAFLGMNPPNWTGMVTTPIQFWCISAPVTLVITLAMAIFLFRDDNTMKDWLRKWIPGMKVRPSGTKYGRVGNAGDYGSSQYAGVINNGSS